MLAALFLFAQLSATTDSTYSTPALRALVAHAAAENRAPPPGFRGYRAHVETELGLILRDTLGRENAGQIEQLASSVRWTRGGDYDMHVVGYRAQGSGVPYSALTVVRGWTEPTLYGDRLRLGAQIGGSAPRTSRDTASRDTIIAVHPFAGDRDKYYRFTGGDTTAVLRTGQRVITIVVVHVKPHLTDSARLAAFEGDIQLDADRGQIVKMRGTFYVLTPRPRTSRFSRAMGLTAAAYSEFVNAEVNGKYWLPATQRNEFQAQFALLGRTRAIVRIVSTFSDYVVDDTRGGALAAGDGNRRARITTWAPSDSVSRFADWQSDIGSATSSVSASDFDDLGPDQWRSTGGVLYDFMPSKPSNVLGYDRVGGLYTGIEGTVRMRSVFPGLSAGGRIGWAWTEKTMRGGAHVNLTRGTWSYGARAERVLASTNDFTRPFEPESGGLAAYLASIDEFDYVDRRRAMVSTSHVFGSFNNAFVTVELGGGQDRAELARLAHGLRETMTFLSNRGAATGDYALGSVDVEVHPNVSGDFVDPGIGGHLHYEMGHGSLTWQRAVLSVSARQYWGPISLSAHADGGVVLGDELPPQQLFEMGGTGTLPGYSFKEFAGDRAALFRGFASYTLPFWRAPMRVWRNLILPGLSPGFAAGVSGGWTEISSEAARASVLAFGQPAYATNGARATAGAGFTLFGGNLHVGVARAIDRPAPWRFALGVGQEF